MIQKSTTERVLAYFYVHPTTEIHLRELARTLQISLPAVLRARKALERERLLSTRKEGPLILLRASTTHPRFGRLKRADNLVRIYESGIVDALMERCNPAAIVLFGSYSRGDDTERSDIDIAIIDGREGDVTLDTYERKLQRPISIFQLKTKEKPPLLENLRNGIVLEGAI